MDDLTVAREALARIRYGSLGVAAIVLPDWAEGDPRWAVLNLSVDHRTREHALALLAEELTRDYHKALRQMIREGRLTRPQLADALGVSLHEVLQTLGEAP